MKRKLLYVDDDLEARAMVAEYLRFRGYEILTVDKAPDALHLAGETRLDVIILDLNLIGLDGPELMGLLQRRQPEVPIILYTGMNPDNEKVKAMLARGACRCVSKDATLDALVMAVHDVLKHPAGVSRDAS